MAINIDTVHCYKRGQSVLLEYAAPSLPPTILSHRLLIYNLRHNVF